MVKISFIMPAYKAAYIREAIRSIVGQTSCDWELVVVDDCSPENLAAIVEEFKLPNVRYVRNEENIGGESLVRQWNRSISLASGEWIVLAGDDDVYEPTFAEEVLRLSGKYPEADLVRARVEQIGERGEHLWDDGMAPEFETEGEFFEDYLEARAFTCIGNYAFRRRALFEAGGFFELPCAFGSDIVTPLLLCGNGVIGTERMLFKFRQSAIHLSADPGKLSEKQEAVNRMFEWFLSDGRFCKYERRIHAKYIYDIFNLVVVHTTFSALIPAIRRCRLASRSEKAVMFLRWPKRNMMGQR